jgi:vanillate monooxygenase ferredoxin subunit
MTGELLPVRVAARELLAPDIAGFTLVHEDGRPLPAFDPGAHIDVHAPGGLVRQYSLCEPLSAGGHYLIGMLRDPLSRGGSARGLVKRKAMLQKWFDQ